MIKTNKTLSGFITLRNIIFLGLLILFQAYCPNGTSAKLIPAPLLKWADKGTDYAVLVDKSAQKVFLYSRDDVSKPVKVYKCSTGENSGPKLKRNDRKTPEGIYFFTHSYQDRELAPIYGVRAFAMDYPNPLDKKQGKGGYGIWFHGTNEPLKPWDSNGCVVLENESIDELASYLRLHETPVIISSYIDRVPYKRQKRESETLQKFVETWVRVWKNKNIDQYMRLYSPSFMAGGMGWGAWKAHKSRLAKKYKKIHVEIDNLQLYRAKDTVFAMFNQTYRTSAFESRGQKKLYLTKNSNQWKIIGEFFERGKIAGKVPPRRKKTSPKEIEDFIHFWKNAWERKELDKYIGLYDRTFRFHGMDLRAWRSYKSRLNRKYGSFKIRVSKVKIIKASGNKLKVRFIQEYKADTYHDSGIKNLFLLKRGKQWKIKKETWRPLPTGRTK
ncbi:MAG: L,D-transpeptidase family protein [Desulfobacterales bacterium]|nr:L,D-transpeptidase family protein [Desulfobacterales bacterium]